MRQITVNKPNGSTIQLSNKELPCTIVSARQEWTLNGGDLVKVTVKSAVTLDLGIGDSISVFGRIYKMNRLPKITKTKTHLLQYECEYEGIQYDLLRVTYDLTVETTSNTLQDVSGDSFTGNLQAFMRILIANANRVFPGGWSLGVCPDTDVETRTFGESDNCLSVLQDLCDKHDLQFEIVHSGGKATINIKQVGQILPYTFQYGKGKGLYSLTRENVSSSNIITRLKVRGSADNITNKYRSDRLLLPGKSKSTSYIEDATAIAKYGVYEATKIFDIKPTFTGHVETVSSILEFVDTSVTFDLNAVDGQGQTIYLLPGVAAVIHFNSGNLAGYEFEIAKYDHATHKFKLKKYTDARGAVFPSETSTAFQFAAGDEYKILQITLPDALITAAENRLLEEAEIYYNQNSQPKVKYSLSIAKEYLENLVGGSGTIVNVFTPGDYLPIKDDDIGVDKSVRIKSFERDLIEEYKYNLTISDTVTTAMINRVISGLTEIDKIIKFNDLQDPARARANWRTSRELLDMVFDSEGDYYTEKIKPLSIDTQLLSVGAKSMQFGLVGTVFEPNFGGNKNSMKVTGGTLVHYTIDVQQAVSWTLANNTFTFQNDSDAFYIYAKCSRTTNAGTILFSTQQIPCESEPDYYHFWIGVLHAVDSETGVRDISLSYGFTMINGRYITTGRIQSADGKNYIDLDENKIRFGNDSCYIDWNVTRNGQFSMRNVKIVSGSGESYDIPVYRGDWKDTTMYYSGDTVTYSDGTSSATYMYINSTPTIGHLVTETAYWKPYASGGAKGDKGDAGDDGQSSFKSIVFKRSSTTPTTPTGGSYLSPVPSGWSDGVPSGEAQLWMSTRIFTSDGLTPQQNAWTTPRQVTDTADIDFEFSAIGSNPGNPTSNPSNWHNTATASDIWMAVRKCKNGTWGSWKVSKIKGEKGDPGEDGANGSSIEVQFSVNGTSSWHATFQTGDKYMRERVGSGSWSSAIKIVGENGQDGQDGQDGADGSHTSFVFQAAESQPAKPTSTSPIPSGWDDEPPICDIVSPTYTGNWVVNGKTLTSNAISHSGSTWEKIQIVTTKENTKVMVRIFASSEANYDFGYICPLDTAQSTSNYLARVSGVQSALVTINIPTSGTHYFYVGYTKDGSGTGNDDKIVVKILDTPRTWMTCAVVSASGVAGTWTTPVLLSGQDGNNGNDGRDGRDGKSPSSPYRGEYASTTTYYGCDYRCDVVKYQGAYYRARPDAPQSPFIGVLPTNTSYWEQFGASYENIATGLLLAEEANIANFLFRNGDMVSQSGKSGAEDLKLDGKNGVIILGGGLMRLTKDSLRMFSDGVTKVSIQNVSVGDYDQTLLKASETLSGNVSSQQHSLYIPSTSGAYTLSATVLNKNLGVLDVGDQITFTQADILIYVPQIASAENVTMSFSSPVFIIELLSNGNVIRTAYISGGKTITSGESLMLSLPSVSAFNHIVSAEDVGSYAIRIRTAASSSIRVSCSKAGIVLTIPITLTLSMSVAKSNFEKTIIGNDGILMTFGDGALANSGYLIFNKKNFAVGFGDRLFMIDAGGMYKSMDGGKTLNEI